MRTGRSAVLLLASAALFVNLGALVPGFIHDDHRIIEQNDLTRGVSALPRIFTSGYWSTGETRVPNLYRPVTILSFAINRAAHGLRPLGFRIVDLLLHVLVTLLVFALGSRLYPRPAAPPGPSIHVPFVAALLFAVHPVHAEALGLVVGRAELLAAACALGSVLAFLRSRDEDRERRGSLRAAGWRALSLALFVLGALAKENAVVVPALLWLADRLVVRRRTAWGFHAASCLTLALLLALRVAVLGGLNPAGPIHFVDNPIAHLPFAQGRLTALAVLGRYALLCVWPAGLSIDYSFRTIAPASGPFDAGVLFGAALVAAWALGAARAWRRRPGAAFALLWIGAALLPVANLLFPIGTIMAERLLYLPSAGLCLAAAAAIARVPRPRAAGLAAALIVLALAARSVVRLRDWRDDYTIFKAALAVAPESVRALFNYGSACEERGDDASAADAYRRALGVWPDFADAHYNLAGVLARQKNWTESEGHYRRALQKQPGNVQYLVNLAHTLSAMERHREARDLLERAVGIDPESALARSNLGAAALALDDVEAALSACGEAARLEPGNADYLRNLGVAQREAGDRGAVETFRRALGIRPDDPDLLDGLGLSLLDAGDAAGARDVLRRAGAARPAHPIYRYHLARALEQAGETQEAVAQYREAIRLAPGAPFPRKGLGLLLERLGDGAMALEELEKAAALDPSGKAMDAKARALLEALRRRHGGGPRPRAGAS